MEVFRKAVDSKYPTTQPGTVEFLKAELARINADFPNLLPEFDDMTYFWGKEAYSDNVRYFPEGICSYLSAAIARLKAEMEEDETTPVTQTREFGFIRDAALRSILERDYREIQAAYIAKCWKSVIILSGGAIEAIVAGILSANASSATSATKAPRNPDITAWDLNDLINVAVELGLITPGVEKLSHSVREYRNLVHPGMKLGKSSWSSKRKLRSRWRSYIWCTGNCPVHSGLELESSPSVGDSPPPPADSSPSAADMPPPEEDSSPPSANTPPPGVDKSPLSLSALHQVFRRYTWQTLLAHIIAPSCFYLTEFIVN